MERLRQVTSSLLNSRLARCASLALLIAFYTAFTASSVHITLTNCWPRRPVGTVTLAVNEWAWDRMLPVSGASFAGLGRCECARGSHLFRPEQSRNIRS